MNQVTPEQAHFATLCRLQKPSKLTAMSRQEKAAWLRLLRSQWTSLPGPRKNNELVNDLSQADMFCIDAALFKISDTFARYLDLTDSLRIILENHFDFRSRDIESWNEKQNHSTVLRAARLMPTF